MTSPSHTHAPDSVAGPDRFGFGANWQKFLRSVDEDRIRTATESLRDMLEVQDLAGRSFLDVGSGSGLFSLAAHRLGAEVYSFDYDPDSVACTEEMRRRYGSRGGIWEVERGDATDADYMEGLGQFDVVYSWGVLHHTGAMWKAIDLTAERVASGGLLFLGLYNDMGEESEKWVRIKRRYCALPEPLKPLYALWAILPYELKDLARNTLEVRPWNYVRSWMHYRGNRGMSKWRDIVDWVGGYPYEYVGVAPVVKFLRSRGFVPQRIVETGGLGCNEWVLRAVGR